MKANHFFEESVKQHKEAAYELYQRMVDEVFGEGAVKIDYVDTDNNVLCCFKYEDCFACFKENLKNRLKCLKFTAKKNDAYQELLHLVKQVADPEEGEYTYFRTLARRTFFGHQCDYMPMCELTPTYYGYESVNEVAEQLTGLVVIDDSGNDGETLCYSFSNPNREREDKIVMTFLELVKLLGANENVYEDFEMDNY